MNFKLSSEIESDLPSHPRPLILLLEPTTSLPLEKVTLEQLSSDKRDWLEYIGTVVVGTKELESFTLEQLSLDWNSGCRKFRTAEQSLFFPLWKVTLARTVITEMDEQVDTNYVMLAFHIFHGFSRWRFFCRLSVDMLSSPSYHASSPLWLVILTIDQSDISTNILSYHH